MSVAQPARSATCRAAAASAISARASAGRSGGVRCAARGSRSRRAARRAARRSRSIGRGGRSSGAFCRAGRGNHRACPGGTAARRVWPGSPNLHRLDDPASVGYAAALLLGTLLDVSRVGYATIDDAAETLHVDRDWTAPGVESLAGVLRLRDYGSFVDNLKRNEIVRIDDVREDARTQEAASALEARSARSFVNVPVVEQGRLVARSSSTMEVRCWSRRGARLRARGGHRTRTAVERVKGKRRARPRRLPGAKRRCRMSALDQRFRARRHRHVGHGRPDGCAVDRDAPLQGHGFPATGRAQQRLVQRYIP